MLLYKNLLQSAQSVYLISLPWWVDWYVDESAIAIDYASKHDMIRLFKPKWPIKANFVFHQKEEMVDSFSGYMILMKQKINNGLDSDKKW